MKYDKDKVEAQLNQEYFARKVDLIPASLKETYSDLVSKHPVLVSRELIVDGRALIGIEYAPDGEVASVYTTDAKGKRVNFENSSEDVANDTATNQISRRLEEVKESLKGFVYEDLLAHERAHETVRAPEPAKRVSVSPRKNVAPVREDR